LPSGRGSKIIMFEVAAKDMIFAYGCGPDVSAASDPYCTNGPVMLK